MFILFKNLQINSYYKLARHFHQGTVFYLINPAPREIKIYMG